MANDRYYKPHNPNREKLGFSDGNEKPIYEEYIESDWSKEEVNELKATRDHFFEMNFWELNSPFGISKLSFDFLEEPQLEDDWNQLLHAWACFSHTVNCVLPEGVERPGGPTEIDFDENNGDMKVKYNPPREDDKKRTIN